MDIAEFETIVHTALRRTVQRLRGPATFTLEQYQQFLCEQIERVAAERGTPSRRGS